MTKRASSKSRGSKVQNNVKVDPNNIGFEILHIKEARNYNGSVKEGFIAVDVKYPSSNQLYSYCRRTKAITGKENYYSVVIDGVEIEYEVFDSGKNNYYLHRGATRIYNTQGRRRRSTESISGEHKDSTVKSEVNTERETTKEPEIEIVECDDTETDKDNTISDRIKSEIDKQGINIIDMVKKFNQSEEEAEQKPEKENAESVKHEEYDTIKTCLESGIPVYLSGPAGSGKNYTVEQICRENGWGFYFSNSVQQEYKLTGFIDAGGKFHETEFYKACTSDKECVFFLDEMDASIPEVLILLNAAIANGYFEFPNGRVDIENVHFVAAGNTVGDGADELYTGRMVLDQATLDRFVIIEFGYDVNIENKISEGNTELVDFVHNLRYEASKKGIRATFSYRCITMVTKLEKSNMDICKIIKIAIMKGLDKDTINTFSSNGESKYHEALRTLQAA